MNPSFHAPDQTRLGWQADAQVGGKLAQLGARTLGELVGRTDLLRQVDTLAATGERIAVTNPADRREVVGHWQAADNATVERALQNAVAAQPGWDAMPASARAAMQAFERAMGTVEGLLADNRGQLDAGMRGLAEIGPAVAELRTTLGSLRAITRQLEDRPADYLLGREPTKEFTP